MPGSQKQKRHHPQAMPWGFSAKQREVDRSPHRAVRRGGAFGHNLRGGPRIERLETRTLLSGIEPFGDLAEGNAAEWRTFATDGAAGSVADNVDHVRVGAQSLRFDTDSGFDAGMAIAPDIPWDLSGLNELFFWVFGDNNTPIGWQGDQPVIVLETATGGVRLQPNRQVMPNHAWGAMHVPLDGDTLWRRIESGTPDLSQVTGLEIHQDTWDYGFRVYYDGIEFLQTDRDSHLNRLRNLEVLLLCSPKWTSDGLATLDLPKLREFTTSGMGGDRPLRLSQLRFPPTLGSLVLQSNDITDDDLRSIGQFSALYQIGLSQNDRLTDEGVRHLAPVYKLRTDRS